MVRQGWLHPLRLSTGPGYLLTPKAARRLDEAAARIYRTHRINWDGTFDLVVLDAAGARQSRARLAQSLAFLGYGSIDETTWVATRAADEIDSVLTEAGLRFERFTAQHAAGTPGATALVRRAWNLDEVGAAYEQFVRELRPVVSAVGDSATDEQAYSARFRLVHAWRSFLFRDPQLPPALLPERWPGLAAAAFFDRHASRLRPAADRYVDRCLDQTSRTLAARHLTRTPVKGVRP
jgi:phenylacetic acid degradation operon negative regulatory protein